jgi:hypothetical protein
VKISNEIANAQKILEKYGLKITPDELAKVPDDQKEEIIKEKIIDFLKSEMDETGEILGENRKNGTDHLIEELKIIQIKSKYKVALSTFSQKDIEKYMNKIREVKQEAKNHYVEKEED